jgi:hypothetical protein
MTGPPIDTTTQLFDVGDEIVIRTTVYRLKTPSEPQDPNAPDGYTEDSPSIIHLKVKGPTDTSPQDITIDSPAGGTIGQREGRVLATTPGRWYWRWESSGTIVGQDEGMFTVRKPRIQ